MFSGRFCFAPADVNLGFQVGQELGSWVHLGRILGASGAGPRAQACRVEMTEVRVQLSQALPTRGCRVQSTAGVRQPCSEQSDFLS